MYFNIFLILVMVVEVLLCLPLAGSNVSMAIGIYLPILNSLIFVWRFLQLYRSKVSDKRQMR